MLLRWNRFGRTLGDRRGNHCKRPEAFFTLSVSHNNTTCRNAETLIRCFLLGGIGEKQGTRADRLATFLRDFGGLTVFNSMGALECSAVLNRNGRSGPDGSSDWVR